MADVEGAKGKAKEVAGTAIGDKSMEREDEAQQRKGEAQEEAAHAEEQQERNHRRNSPAEELEGKKGPARPGPSARLEPPFEPGRVVSR